MTRDEVVALFQEKLPIGDSELGVELVLAGEDTLVEDGGNYRVTLRMIVWDKTPDGASSIRDIKEQEIWAGRLGDQSPERMTAFLEGWDAAFRAIVRAGADLDCYMPHDLSHFNVFDLKTVQLAEDFEQALLARKRLGRCLPRGVDANALDASVPAGITPPRRDDDAL